MILEFSVKNFKSVKERQNFSLVAESTKHKRDTNTFQIEIGKNDKVQLLKSAVVYGANASGKSNFIKAFNNLRSFIISSRLFDGREQNVFYEPFAFDVETASADTEHECVFVLNNIKFSYAISFNLHNVTFEELNYYPKNVRKNLFKRIIEQDDLIDTVRFAKDVSEIDLKAFPEHFTVYKNQAILSKFGSDYADRFFYRIYSYFYSWYIWSNNTQMGIEQLSEIIISKLIPQSGDDFFRKLERLIKAGDTKIDNLVLMDENDETSFSKVFSFLNGTLPKPSSHMNRLFASHAVYDGNKIVNQVELPFRHESAGTHVLFAFGAYILRALEDGGVVVFDELDNSLHPKLARFLVSLFNNSTINTKNAQIIFTSHEANLIDKDMFRSDQIWFTNKNGKGETEIYSAQDFEGVREDVPFDKWYLAGKFGALPDIKEMEYIFKDERRSR